MARSVAIYYIENRHRSRVVCEAMRNGIELCGQKVRLINERDYAGVDADVAVFYGLEGNTPRIFRDYARDAKAAYVDLGYWGRVRPDNKWEGYHKIVINDRHPTAYFQRRRHPADRAAGFDIKLSPWNSSERFPIGHKPILLAGMGDKGAAAEGFEPEEWERWAIAKIREVTKRIIIYRPKPSWKMARPIRGQSILYSESKENLNRILPGVHAVVTHHSNVGIDGLIAGIPCFTIKGAALSLGCDDLKKIEEPVRPEGREQFLNDLAYCQWSVPEMRNGTAWRGLLEEGLV